MDSRAMTLFTDVVMLFGKCAYPSGDGYAKREVMRWCAMLSSSSVVMPGWW